MPTTWLDLADSAIKIGLGGLIGAAATITTTVLRNRHEKRNVADDREYEAHKESRSNRRRLMESVVGAVEPFFRCHRDFLITVVNVGIQCDEEIQKAGKASIEFSDQCYREMYDAAPLEGVYSENYHIATGQVGILMLAGVPRSAEQLRELVIFLVMQRDDLVSKASSGTLPAAVSARTARAEFEKRIGEFLGALATAYNHVEK
ncbi:hypothetical protein [Burkholderia diffusa]|uniref:hypothetical protein n=1 Tax=Burkholderia diffusa TaxID=488732 RepID=UPI002AAF546D|nr:hypothetical protein [Burkholderia diffusa]